MTSRSASARLVLIAYSAFVAAAALAILSVPIRAFGAELDMPVPASVIYPGQNVVEKGLDEKRFRISGTQLQTYALDQDMLEGKVARRTLLPGRPILLSDLKSPDVVKAGVGVTMVYQAGGLTITSLGVPLQSGAEGETIRLRNADSGTTVAGIVAADGTVRIAE